MKHLLFIVSSALVMSLLSACGSQPAQKVYQVPSSLKSQQCFLTQSESQIWLEKKEEWEALPVAARQQFESAEVDFSQHNVLIISAGQKATAGYDLELTHWLLEQDHWQVTRIVRQPPEGAMLAQVITSPCLLVKIPKAIKTFALNDENGQVLGRWPY